MEVRCVFVDYYMAPQLPKGEVIGWSDSWKEMYEPKLFKNNMNAEYPVIRIFGSTPGKKHALNI